MHRGMTTRLLLAAMNYAVRTRRVLVDKGE
jgi:hypothetical protein